MDGQKTVVAEIVRPRGIRGELIAISQTDVPGRLKSLSKAQAQLSDGTDVPVEISHAWEHKGNWVLKLLGVDSIEAADRFRGADLWVPLEERGSLPAGEFFRSDLIGCQVIDRATGEPVGSVRGWQQHGGAAPLMEVAGNLGDALVPFVADLCEVDLERRTIRMNLPAGLLEL